MSAPYSNSNRRRGGRSTKAMRNNIVPLRNSWYDPDAPITADSRFVNQAIGRTPFPARYQCKHTYSETITLTTGTAGVSPAEYSFRLTSLYDPNLTGTGHQPYGFDQVTVLYARYLVKHVNVIIRMTTNASAAGEVMASYGIRGVNDFQITTGWTSDQFTENPQFQTQIIQFGASSQNTREARISIQPWSIMGTSKQSYMTNLDQYGSLNNTNPTLCPLLVLNVSSPGGTAGDKVYFNVVIMYSAEWSERVLQNQS